MFKKSTSWKFCEYVERSALLQCAVINGYLRVKALLWSQIAYIFYPDSTTYNLCDFVKLLNNF